MSARCNGSIAVIMSSVSREYKALVVESKGKVSIQDVSIHLPERGDVTVRVMASYVNPNSKEVLLDGENFLPGSDFPFVWGCQAIGRVEETGGDEVHVKKRRSGCDGQPAPCA